MPDHRLDGCRSTPLLSYLKALGVLRVVASQADPSARSGWREGALTLATTLGHEELREFFLDDYEPAPVVSPWNGGSGFYAKDNKLAREMIEATIVGRLGAYRDSFEIAARLVRESGLDGSPGKGEPKNRLLRKLRSELPETALPWLDASATLVDGELRAAPLLGSGGNDGRFDIANNYAQAVVLAVLWSKQNSRESSASALAASLDGGGIALDAVNTAYLNRDSSPVNSPHGEADAKLGNRWDLVLAVEGALLFGAGAARRLGASLGALVAPFTSGATAAGYGSAAAAESGAYELWLPLWSEGATLPEIAALFREGRVQVGRRNARSGLDFVRASGALGVTRGIDAFERYALLERSGQSRLAVPVGAVAVRERPAAGAITGIDRWLRSLERFVSGEPPRSVEEAARDLERKLFAFADRPDDSANCCEAIGSLGAVERSLALSLGGGKADNAGRLGLRPVRDAPALPWLEAGDDGSPEFAVAASIASLRDRPRTGLPAVRDYLNGTHLEPKGRRYGHAAHSPLPRRGDPLIRLAALHARRHLDAAKHRAPSGRSPSGKDSRSLGFDLGIPCPIAATRLLARGALNSDRILTLASGLSLFEFRDVRDWQPGYDGAAMQVGPFPVLDHLLLAWAGIRDLPLSPRQGWAARLSSGSDAAVGSVVRDALLRLQLAASHGASAQSVSLAPVAHADDLLVAMRGDGPALAAALVMPMSVQTRFDLARHLTVFSDHSREMEESNA